MFEQIEVAAARATDATIAISEDERSAMLRLVPNATVVVLPNVFTSPAAPAGGLDGRAGLLFVGGFGHVPNGDAIRWFAAEIWPMIHAEEPDCRLLVVGSNPGDDVLALAAIPGVEVTGYVTDLEPIYARARVTIAPLRFGAGAKGKVGESLAHGVPVVATTIGAEGMGLVDGENVLVADTGTQFAAQVLQLMRSDDLWLRLSRNGVDHVARAFSPDAARAVLADLLSTSG
jgi:glycosyltransferase involved in cell wall biosynthesis